jgi:hypothetical protein
MAARLVQPDRFTMTARVIVPINPVLMTRPKLMEEVFIRAPALRSLQGKALAEDPRFAIGIYRAAVATGAMDFVRFAQIGHSRPPSPPISFGLRLLTAGPLPW